MDVASKIAECKAYLETDPAVDKRLWHINWCKKRAYEYVQRGDARNAMNSLVSDLGKNDDTKGLVQLAIGLMMIGQLTTLDEVERFIDGFN